jgi:hypothetical protein
VGCEGSIGLRISLPKLTAVSQIRSAPTLRNDRLLGSIPLTLYEIGTYPFPGKVIPLVNAGVKGRGLPELHHQYEKGFESFS